MYGELCNAPRTLESFNSTICYCHGWRDALDMAFKYYLKIASVPLYPLNYCLMQTRRCNIYSAYKRWISNLAEQNKILDYTKVHNCHNSRVTKLARCSKSSLDCLESRLSNRWRYQLLYCDLFVFFSSLCSSVTACNASAKWSTNRWR